METSPITNASMGIKNDGSKFRDIRTKAQEESVARRKSKKKDKAVLVLFTPVFPCSYKYLI
jgi:hypothetical protein